MKSYETQGVCSKQIEFEVENNIVKNVKFTAGCSGNLQAMAALVQGMPVEEVVKRLKGIQCGSRTTSCGDQLAQALEKE